MIGRIGDRAIRERWQDCDVGDAVPGNKFEHGEVLFRLYGCLLMDKIVPQTLTRVSFERVVTNLRDADGLEHRTAFWKRLS